MRVGNDAQLSSISAFSTNLKRFQASHSFFWQGISGQVNPYNPLVRRQSSSFSPCSSPWSSGNHSWRLFQKTIEDFGCKINVAALGAALWHSLGGSEGQAQFFCTRATNQCTRTTLLQASSSGIDDERIERNELRDSSKAKGEDDSQKLCWISSLNELRDSSKAKGVVDSQKLCWISSCPSRSSRKGYAAAKYCTPKDGVQWRQWGTLQDIPLCKTFCTARRFGTEAPWQLEEAIDDTPVIVLLESKVLTVSQPFISL